MVERFDSAYDFSFQEEAAGDRGVRLVPVGISGGEQLGKASAQALLDQHLSLERTNVKAFWKDGFILLKLWSSGSYRRLHGNHRSTPYPWSKDGFHDFLHDHGAQISPDEVSRRMKVFKTYNRFDVTTIRLVEKAGVNKAFAAVPHIQHNNVKDVLLYCIDTPYHKLRQGLQEMFPRTVPSRNRRTKDELRRENEERAVGAIEDSPHGMLGEGDQSIFVPRQYRQESIDELRAFEVFRIAMKRQNCTDRDVFFMRVVDLVAQTWLTEEDRKAIENLRDVHRSIDAAIRGRPDSK